MYTKNEIQQALNMYDKTQSITEVIRKLGYPSKQALYTWISQREKVWQKPNGFRGINTAEHPRHPSADLKLSAIKACFEDGKIYNWFQQKSDIAEPVYIPGEENS